MKLIHIKKGKNIPLKGQAKKRIQDADFSLFFAIKPIDFNGFKPRILAKEGDLVLRGTPVLEDKNNTKIKIVSPVSGCVKEIRRGEKRRLLEIVIEADDRRDYVQYTKFSPVQVPGLSTQQVKENLLETGSWSFIRQRPFECIANPEDQPKAIFVEAIDTHPLAGDVGFMLDGQDEVFQTGLDIIQKLTAGKVYLCVSKNAKNTAFVNARGVDVVAFGGSHPAGNVGTHIHCLDPIGRGEVVWFINAQDVAAIAQSFLTGQFSSELVVAVTGESAKNPVYKKTIRGASVESISGQKDCEGARVISGNVLTGEDVGPEGFLGFYDQQICLFPRGGKREFLGWTMPGFDKFSLSRTFFPFWKKHGDTSIDSDTHGSPRTIVFNHVFDQYVALDVMTFFLLKAILAEEIDEMERLGILECAPEDFALAEFACPSKTQVCDIIQKGLDLVKDEG